MPVSPWLNDHREYDGHRFVHYFEDPSVGLSGIVARHRNNHPGALGGTRIVAYENSDAALTDVLRLSRGMGRKSAWCELPLDGCKFVLIAPGDISPENHFAALKTPEYLHAYGRILYSFHKLGLITGEDLNVFMHDADVIAETANDDAAGIITIAGLSAKGGDPSPITAQGVVHGMRACLEHTHGSDTFTGRTITIQGVGKVGFALAGLLIEEGAHVIAADTNSKSLEDLLRLFGDDVTLLMESDEIYDTGSDIFAPCAKGGILNRRTIARLEAAGCKIVAGSANNQLDTPGDGYHLLKAGIAYAPDYVINSGGLLNIFAELDEHGYNEQRVLDAVALVRDRIADILTRSASAAIPTSKLADTHANRIVGH